MSAASIDTANKPHAERRKARMKARKLMPRRAALVLAGVCAGVLCGCADVSMPAYKRPEAPMKSSWSGKTSVSPTEAITLDWWRNFNDPYLDGLVTKAIQGNLDLKILAARLRVAGAEIGEARAGSTLGDLRRCRIGDFPVIAAIRDELVTVLVVRVGHRSDVYR